MSLLCAASAGGATATRPPSPINLPPPATAFPHLEARREGAHHELAVRRLDPRRLGVVAARRVLFQAVGAVDGVGVRVGGDAQDLRGCGGDCGGERVRGRTMGAEPGGGGGVCGGRVRARVEPRSCEGRGEGSAAAVTCVADCGARRWRAAPPRRRAAAALGSIWKRARPRPGAVRSRSPRAAPRMEGPRTRADAPERWIRPQNPPGRGPH